MWYSDSVYAAWYARYNMLYYYNDDNVRWHRTKFFFLKFKFVFASGGGVDDDCERHWLPWAFARACECPPVPSVCVCARASSYRSLYSVIPCSVCVYDSRRGVRKFSRSRKRMCMCACVWVCGWAVSARRSIVSLGTDYTLYTRQCRVVRERNAACTPVEGATRTSYTTPPPRLHTRQWLHRCRPTARSYQPIQLYVAVAHSGPVRRRRNRPAPTPPNHPRRRLATAAHAPRKTRKTFSARIHYIIYRIYTGCYIFTWHSAIWFKSWKWSTFSCE